ncbi:hypothetical protein MLD38_014988 [Melastoma candidum]|uniref:Uncharacterized protein n=1 Tax=Melastoma candidum TaxID=119954 RepID=A0ACB9RIT2_9MYRT|nr:hypothetical protein MLD38_014988 [Melastoma candidum]
MDGNKDDALKCFKMGKEALDLGDHARAIKFLSKAARLDPSLPVGEFISQIDSANPTPKADRLDPDPPPPARRRSPAAATAADGTSSSSSATFTEEQVSVVRKIRKKKDYYEILGLERSCSVEDIRKSYRKLSLKVHPDKNQAPGADEAFKLVSKAFQCLSNAESRKTYDISGSDEPVYNARAARRSHGGQGFNGYYEAEFDADEIFRNFFFGAMHPATTTAQFRGFNFGVGGGGFRHGNAGDNNGTGGFNARMLIQLLPVILILLLNFLPSSDPVYSLSRIHAYEYKYTTARGVDYYVKSGSRFNEDYPAGSDKREAIEGRVERDYVSLLAQNCRLEMQRRQWGFVRETPHCNMLQRFEEASRDA